GPMAKPSPKKPSLPANRRTGPEDVSRSHEIAGIVALGAGAFLLLAMIALQTHAMFMGPFGRSVATLAYRVAGICGYALIALGMVAAVRSLIEKRPVVPWEIGAGIGLGVVALAVLLHLAFARYRVAGIGPGGALGENLAEILRALISTVGTALLAV